ncbi:MAG: hypothetical protein IJJ33_04380 [Victivallales bacterium]|nr:hypothetical protein [Victivallales bacterium]
MTTERTAKVTADFNSATGEMRPMHGVGQPPMMQTNDSLMHYLGEAGIPFSRLHDVQGAFGSNRFVDIPNVFPDFDADENDPSSYVFGFTDVIISALVQQGVEPFYRLGVTIENYPEIKAWHIFPPKDFAKWARICEHIIRHYNEGWADGFHYNIRFWEIWNEPDDAFFEGGKSFMWRGTPEQFCELYVTAAKHLKGCFGDAIKIGGYSSWGFHHFEESDLEMKTDPPKTRPEGVHRFAHQFLQHVRREGAPLDFFSWHSYVSPERTVKSSFMVRRLLEKYGFGRTLDIQNEWNTTWYFPKERKTAMAAAKVLEMMLKMQNCSQTWMLNYYDARIGSSKFSGLFNPDTWKPYLAYFPFKMFDDAYRLKQQVRASSDHEQIVVCGASDGQRKVLLLVNAGSEEVETAFEFEGANPADAEIIMTNDESQIFTANNPP